MQLRISGYAKRGILSRYLVINALRRRPLSRAELARDLGLSPAAITAIADELLEHGVIREDGYMRSERGRRPMRLRLREDSGYAVGVDMTADDALRVALLDLACTVVSECVVPLRSADPAAVVDAIGAAYREVLSAGGVPEASVLGVGITSPGPMAYQSGVVERAVLFGWRNVPLTDMVRAKLGKLVVSDLDVNLAAMGEYWYGDGGEPAADLVYITVGAGIASAFLLDGEVRRGRHTSLGELGHTVIAAGGLPCECGSRGCLETVASQRAMLRWVHDRIRAGSRSSLAELEAITAAAVYEHASAGDSLAIEAVERVAYYVGLATANLINLLSPSLVVIGGPIWPAMDIFLPVVQATVAEAALPELAAYTKIIRSRLGPKAAVVGAAVLVLEEAFRVPVNAAGPSARLAAVGH